MAFDQPRRATTVPLPVPDSYQTPPPAPPLPPQQRARNVWNRFLGFPARPSDSDEDGSQTRYWAEANRATLGGRLPSLSAHNASASHKTGLEINSVSINDEGTHALLAGRDILKTVRVDEGSCIEDFNLRTAIRTFDAHNAAGGPAKDAINIHDVAWGKGGYGHFIAAATYNGPIVVYDLGHPGIEVARLHEHRRQVHRVTFNPHAGQHFLSGSQDGTVRLWDLRNLRRDSATFASSFKTTGQNEGVRDVKWSPTDVFALALCTDGGFVQRWDTRKLKTPLAKIAAHTRIAAHTSSCATIDWHPDGKHVLSASSDKTVKVWNLSGEGRRNKPAYEIKTPHPLRNARWRPSCQSSLPKDRGARYTSQIVASYERDYDVLHIWDFRRPHLPFREIQGYRSAPADLLWHSQDLLWTVGKEGMFLQHDVKYTHKVLDNRNMQAIGVSPLGNFNLATQRRPGRVRPALESKESEQFIPRQHQSLIDQKSGGQNTINSRGSADDSVDDTFLSTSFGKKNSRHGNSNAKGGNSNIDTRPTSTPVDQQHQQPSNLRTLSLDDILTKKRIFKPGQGTAAGILPGAPNGVLLAYFAQKYKTRPLSEPPTVESFLKIQELFESNAKFAQQASMYRMAQAWRLAGRATMTELLRRANAHRVLRVKGVKNSIVKKSALEESPFARRTRRYLASERRLSSKPNTPLSRPVKTVESLQNLHLESTSNMPTPIARPVSERPGSAVKNRQPPLREFSQDDEGLALPPSLLSPAHIERQKLDRVRQVSTTNDQSWFESTEALDQRRAELGSWRAQTKKPFTLEHNLEVRPKTERHNSDESFAMFPSLSSREASNPVSSAASMSSLMNTVQHNLMGDSPHGSMNLGSSSSSEPTMDQGGFPKSFVSYPSAVAPREVTTAVESSPSEADDAPHLETGVGPANRGQPTDIPPVRDIARDVQTLVANNQHSFSSESEAPSSSARTQPSPDVRPQSIQEEENENMEASMTIVPPPPRSHSRLLRRRVSSDSITKPTTLLHAIESAPAALPRRPSLKPEDVPFVPADFVGTDYPVDTELNTPFTLISMLNQLLDYHTTRVPDAQAATHFLFLLTPLLPQTHSLPQAEIDRTITVYSEHFALLGYTDEEIYSLLQNSFESLIKAGLQPLQAESIISTYHTQLQHAGLSNNAAYLRRLSFPTYPSVYEQGLKDTEMSFLCGNCKKPINNPVNKFYCETCEVRLDNCPICYCATSPFEPVVKRSSKTKKEHRESGGLPPLHSQQPLHDDDSDDPDHMTSKTASWAAKIRKPLLYSTCLLCNHTAHTSCLRAWHGASGPSTASSPAEPLSEGLCPTPGCVCACTPGPVRSALMQQIEAEEMERRGSKASSMRARVKDDDWVAAESKAVAALAGGSAGSAGAGPGAGVRKRSAASGVSVVVGRGVDEGVDGSDGGGGGGVGVTEPGRAGTGNRRGHERKKSSMGGRHNDAGYGAGVGERKNVGFRE